MKRFFCLMLMLVLSLCGCEKDVKPTVEPEALNEKVALVNEKQRLSGDYQLELTFGDRQTLYFSKGEVAWDRLEKSAYAFFDQTYLGSSSKTENFFKDGKMLSVSDGEKIDDERDSDELFSKFPYCKIPLHNESCGEITESTSTVGQAFSFSRSDGKEISRLFVEDDIFDLVGVFKKPQKDKTEYGEVQCIYTVKDDRIVSCRFEVDMKLFDTPPYIPDYSVPEEEYTITVHVTAKISYDNSENITIKEYSEESDASKEE